jgi:hypothetical protein
MRSKGLDTPYPLSHQDGVAAKAALILAYAGKIELRYINTNAGIKTYFMAK